MSIYKKGDKVKLKKYDVKFHNFPPGVGVNHAMMKYFDTVVTISYFISSNTFKIKDVMWNWSYEWIDHKVIEVNLPDELFTL